MRNLHRQITSHGRARRGQFASPRRVTIAVLTSLLLLTLAVSGRLSGTVRQVFHLAQAQPQLLTANMLAPPTQITPLGQPGGTLPSGQIPFACFPYTRSDQLVDCWLMSFPNIAQAIVWDFGPPYPLNGAGQLDYSTSTKAWPQWDAHAKEQLRNAVQNARTWYRSGMRNYPGTLVSAPPLNLNEAAYSTENGVYALVYSKSDAWGIYLEHVGLSLAAEIDGIVPWSLRNYGTKQLGHLFNGVGPASYDSQNGARAMFRPSEITPGLPAGYVNSSGITPTNATYAFKFLKENDLIGPTPKETIGRVLHWAKQLTHYTDGGGGLTAGQNNYAHWQYYGGQTVSRTIAGTVLTTAGPNSGWGGLKHWTAGCGGTTAFLIWVLRTVNIPAVGTISGNLHNVVWFSGENLFLSHSDDPYGRSAEDYPGEKLLLSEATFKSWFRDNGPQVAMENVGRGLKEVAVYYPSQEVVKDFCKDVKAGQSHASGKVYNDWFKKPYFTVAQLEAKNLWERLEKKANLTGACQP